MLLSYLALLALLVVAVRRLAEVAVPHLADVLSADVAYIGACNTQKHTQTMSVFLRPQMRTGN
jgi:hypothetical protein